MNIFIYALSAYLFSITNYTSSHKSKSSVYRLNISVSCKPASLAWVYLHLKHPKTLSFIVKRDTLFVLPALTFHVLYLLPLKIDVLPAVPTFSVRHSHTC